MILSRFVQRLKRKLGRNISLSWDHYGKTLLLQALETSSLTIWNMFLYRQPDTFADQLTILDKTVTTNKIKVTFYEHKRKCFYSNNVYSNCSIWVYTKWHLFKMLERAVEMGFINLQSSACPLSCFPSFLKLNSSIC